MIKKLITFILCALMLVVCIPFTQTEALTVQGYEIDVTELGDPLDNYIKSFYLQKNEDSYGLYINDEYIHDATGNPLVYTYRPLKRISITISCNLNNQSVSFSSDVHITETFVPAFEFDIESDGSQSVTFYPTGSAFTDTVKRIITKDANGIYDCGTFTYRYDGESRDSVFTCVLDTNTSIATISKDGQSVSKQLKSRDITRNLYYECYINAQELELEYMNDDSYKTTYVNANSSSYYTDAMIDGLVSNKTVTLINKQTSEQYTLPLRRTIGVMNRVGGDEEGTGEYEDTDQSMTVVVSYEELSSEDKASFGVDGKSYAVFADADTKYQYVKENGEGSRYVSGNVEQYKNISWNDYVFTSTISALNTAKASLSTDLQPYFLGEYAYRYALSKTESGYIYESTSSLPKGDDYQYSSKTFWQIRNYNWQLKGYYATTSDVYKQAQSQSSSSDKTLMIISSDSQNATAYRKRTASAAYPNPSAQTFKKGSKSSNSTYARRVVYKYAIYKKTDKTHLVAYDTKYSTQLLSDSAICDTSKYDVVRTDGYQEVFWLWSGYSEPMENISHTNTYGYYEVAEYKSETIKKYRINEKTYTSNWTTVDYVPQAITGRDIRQSTLYNQTHITKWSEWSAYGDYSDYIYASGYINQLGITQYKFRYRLPKSSLSPIPGGDVLYVGSYYSGVKEYGYAKGMFAYTKCIEDDQQIDPIAKATDYQIKSIAKEIENAYLECKSYDSLVENGQSKTQIAYEEVKANIKKDSVTLASAKQYSIDNFLGKKIFVPYIYIRSHWRATSHETTFNAYDHCSCCIGFNIEEDRHYDDSAKLIYKERIAKRENCRIVFFDYHDPMYHYPDELPDNWVGYEWLVEEIKNSDFDNPKVKVTITKQDMREMKQWLIDRNYVYEEGEFLKAFKHCFTINDFPELEALLNE